MLFKVFLASFCLNVALASPFSPDPNHGHPYRPSQRALYIQDNDPSGNNVIAAEVSSRDGKLSNAVKVATGGTGLAQLIAASQDSVVVAGSYLFVTNAGDNTLSVFAIDPNKPTSLRLLGKPMDTRGHTPVSVTYSEALNMDIPQTELADPSPAIPGPLVLSADIRFNPSSTELFATVRSNGALPGILYSWPIHLGKFTTKPVNNTLPGIALPFSLNFLGSDSRLFLTNPHFGSDGAAILDISPSGKVAHTQNITIPGQLASCWVAWDQALSKAFVVDAGRPVITIVDTGSGRVTNQFNFTTPAAGSGGQDTKIDRNFLYVLTDPVNPNTLELVDPPQVLVYDVSPVQRGGIPQEIQSFDILKIVGKLPGAIGLAVYPAARFN